MPTDRLIFQEFPILKVLARSWLLVSLYFDLFFEILRHLLIKTGVNWYCATISLPNGCAVLLSIGNSNSLIDVFWTDMVLAGIIFLLVLESGIGKYAVVIQIQKYQYIVVFT